MSSLRTTNTLLLEVPDISYDYYKAHGQDGLVNSCIFNNFRTSNLLLCLFVCTSQRMLSSLDVVPAFTWRAIPVKTRVSGNFGCKRKPGRPGPGMLEIEFLSLLQCLHRVSDLITCRLRNLRPMVDNAFERRRLSQHMPAK